MRRFSSRRSRITVPDAHHEGRGEKFEPILAEVQVLEVTQNATALRQRGHRLDLVVSQVKAL